MPVPYFFPFFASVCPGASVVRFAGGSAADVRNTVAAADTDRTDSVGVHKRFLLKIFYNKYSLQKGVFQ